MDENGLLASIEFGHLKREFRGFIDHYLDHQCLLNKVDPFAQPLFGDSAGAGGNTTFGASGSANVVAGGGGGGSSSGLVYRIPGLRACEGDPTTENIAMWIGQWAQTALAIPLVFSIGVQVEETPVNSGTWSGDGLPAEIGTQCLTDILGRLEPIEKRHPDERNLYYPAPDLPDMPVRIPPRPIDEDAPL